MSDTNRVGLRFAKTSGVDFPLNPSPASLQQLRFTQTPSLAFAPQTIQSSEIRPDRQISDLALIGGQAGGDVDFELSALAFDPFLASVLFASWIDPPALPRAAIASITVAGGKTVVTATGATFILAGHIVKLTGVPGVGNGVFVVESKAGNALTLADLDGTQLSGDLAAVPATARVDVVGAYAPADSAFDIDVTAGVMTIQAAAAAFSNIMGDGKNLVPGQWVKIAGAATAGNNVWMRLTEVTASALKGVAPQGAASENVAGRLAIYFGGYVRNTAEPEGLAAHTYLIERRFQDHNPVDREVFVGMILDQLQLTLEQSAIVNGKLVWFGNQSAIDDNVAKLYQATPADLPAPTGDVLNTANNVARLGLGADQVDRDNRNAVLSATLTIANNLRRRGAVRHFGSVGTGLGALSVTGQLTTYFDSRANLDRLLKNQETSLDFVFSGGDKAGLVVDLPRIKFSGGAPEVAGQNQDVTLPLTYQALRHAVLGYTVHLQRVRYAA